MVCASAGDGIEVIRDEVERNARPVVGGIEKVFEELRDLSLGVASAIPTNLVSGDTAWIALDDCVVPRGVLLGRHVVLEVRLRSAPPSSGSL